MAQDMIKEIYDILNYHLGERQRNAVRLPDKYDALKGDLTKFIVYTSRLGQSLGRQQVTQELIGAIDARTEDLKSKYEKLAQDITKPQSKAGVAEDGYKARNPEVDTDGGVSPNIKPT